MMHFEDNKYLAWRSIWGKNFMSDGRHPEATTLSRLGAGEQLRTGATEGYIRLAVGIEHIDDILADLDQALDAA